MAHDAAVSINERRRRVLRIAAVTVVVLLAIGAGAGFIAYRHLNRNIASEPLTAAPGAAAPTEPAVSFGSGPLNILVIGSDSRSSAANCKLGGDCSAGRGQNADVEMVVHVAADRSNMTVMSVPRDTITDLPACTDARTGATLPARRTQINFSLDGGPGCTVDAVRKLTGIPIDHFVLVDFAGVITVSDAVGGVPICVSGNVYDTYSHLKLTGGSHTLKGEAALQFLRSRHAFGDGSDLGRTYAQHAFLSAALRQMRSTGTLLNPARVYGMVDAATRAVTVDPGLAGLTRLVGLVRELDRVPSDRITFTTMQTDPDPADPNRVVVSPLAGKLFAAIVADRSLSRPAAAPAPSSSPAAPASSPSPSAGASTGSAGAVDQGATDRANAVRATDSGCVQVSRLRTVVLNGVLMTPGRAFDESPDRRVSAP